MLGRTDSRRRLLFLLVVFVVGTGALVARLGYWQVVDQQRLAAEAKAQTTVTIDTPSRRGDIFDRTGTVVLATTVQRERLIAAPDQLTPETRRQTVATLTGILGLCATASTGSPATGSGPRCRIGRLQACRWSRSRSGSTRKPAGDPTRVSPRTCSGS
jgi:hypothetical protein